MGGKESKRAAKYMFEAYSLEKLHMFFHSFITASESEMERSSESDVVEQKRASTFKY